MRCFQTLIHTKTIFKRNLDTYAFIWKIFIASKFHKPMLLSGKSESKESPKEEKTDSNVTKNKTKSKTGKFIYYII